MTSDREGPGSLRWTISHDGKVRLGMANESDGDEANWIVGISPQVITTNRLGQWLMLATTYDGKTMCHYLDGQLVWSGAIAGPSTSSFDWVEIGNWVATPDLPAFSWAKSRNKDFFNRHLKGCIDEVAVLSRAMPGDEIRKLYQLGRPIKPTVVVAELPGHSSR